MPLLESCLQALQSALLLLLALQAVLWQQQKLVIVPVVACATAAMKCQPLRCPAPALLPILECCAG
jgi:4-amino-4-deoxy-L-arabinose transferase-like glycosyltransferase